MSRPARVALVGAAGRMGHELTPLIEASEDLQLTHALDRDPGLVSVLPGEIDAVIEFTTARAVPAVAREVTRLGVPWLTGTTGLSREEFAAIEEAARSAPVLWSPNYSLGVAFVTRALALAARLLPAGWELEIVESHHAAKLDAPSGTAVALAEAWRTLRGGALVHGRSGKCGPRPPREVGIHAVRLPESVGEHRLLLGGASELIEITHRALDRAALARGAVEGLRWLLRQPPGLHTLDQWIEDRLR